MISQPTAGNSLLEDYLCAAAGGDGGAFTRLAAGVKKLIKQEQFDEAAGLIRAVANGRLDYTSVQTLARLFRSGRGKCKASAQKVRLAVLSSFTCDQLTQMIELFLFAGGVDAELYEAPYGVFRQEILLPESELYRFAPKVVFIATSWRDLSQLPELGEDVSSVGQRVAAEQGQWSALWETLHKRAGCQIVQNNFDRPAWRQLGNHEMRHAASAGRFIAQMNESFARVAPPYVAIHDLDELSASVGRRTWGDERYFHHAKLPCAPECLVEYAHSVASMLLAQLGLGKKCLVLDLDNTLWGGVIGDDGLGGIRLGQGDPEGEAFAAFQRYVQKLRQRGVILAVCSKNTDSIAREVFEKHTEMVLKLADISCFVANWEDKASNLKAIAKQLNIGLNSLVFVDDNPAERAIVRQLAPEVAVPEVSTDPLDFITALEQGRYFQVVSLGNEDLQRTAMYQANAERQSIEASSENLGDFLKSLDMVATVSPINEMNLERSAQLINKSNQFNLTTIRRSTAEVLTIARDPNWATWTVSLRDRFGDNGLITVILGHAVGDALEIDTWLMSCRVLKRNVEKLVLNLICAEGQKRGLRIVRGRYVPTAKNMLVKEHYTDLGFNLVDGPDAQGVCVYELELAGYKPLETCMDVKGAIGT